MTSVTRWCVRHAWPAVLAWLLLTAALIAGAATAPGPTSDGYTLPGWESARAAELMGDRLPEPPGALVVSTSVPASRQAVAPLLERMNTIPGVTTGTLAEARLSPDGTLAVIPIDYEGSQAARALTDLRDGFHAAGVVVELSADDFADFSPGGVSEGVGLLAAAIILLVAFRSLIAMALPLLVGVIGVACGICLLILLRHLVPAPGHGVAMAAMLGLGVGVDYALLIVTRFRTGLDDGLPVEDAVTRAMATAGRSVLFAGLTVIITGAGILFLGPAIGGGMALSAACGVLTVMLAALTLLPALLRLIGIRIDKRTLPRRHGGGAPLSRRWSELVRRRPRLTGLLALGLMVLLALPAVNLRFGWSDASNRPVTDTTRRAHDLLADAFGPGMAGPLVLVSAQPLGGALDQAARTPGVAAVTPLDATTALVVPATGPQEEATTALVHALRDRLPGPVLVTGVTAGGVDFAEHSFERLPWTAGAVLLAAFAMLVAVFRSLVVPLKALAVNVLSIGAAYGVVVAVFQWDVLGLGTGGPVDAWVPMMLFVVTFGLSMDYEVFLLSRIQEEYRRTGDNSRAVADGLAKTARVITAAAAIMFCVFAAFGSFDDRALRIMGVGLAAAVLVDATVVRLVLVPAAMELLGDRNWWWPFGPKARQARRTPVSVDR
ncbi:MMPL family transporter [Nonomuraea sp. NPDC046570]|uniref:MMPL family transporter n=1 Tax=Nonomuraea sp. NPDC046570 TaxID=3155255 RepID=UPI00340CC058